MDSPNAAARCYGPAVRIVLLGCGFHGRGIAYQLAQSGPDVELSVLDREASRAAAVGDKAGLPWGTIDVTDRDRLREALEGADAVVNAVGPYHRTALGVIEAAIDVGIHYVDMNDDHEVAEALLLDPAWDERARRAGVTILIDCGVVPGLSGLLVRHASVQLDRTDRVAIRFGWNYNRSYPAAIQHFLRINSGRGLQYLDGRHVRMPPFEGREDVDFDEPVGRTGVYYTGIPDPVAIARFIPGVRDATAKGAFYQPDANRLMRDMIR
jgi:saccharopine dehydrogenase-like NADP-dependent oxidoreductase